MISPIEYIRRRLSKEDRSMSLFFIRSFSHLEAVNSGGCGRAAYLAIQELTRQGILAEAKLIACTTDYKDFCKVHQTSDLHSAYLKEINHRKTQGEGNAPPHNHIVVKVGNRLYDSTGDVTLSTKVQDVVLPLTTLKLINKSPLWNPYFGRNNPRKEIAKMKSKVRLSSKLYLK